MANAAADSVLTESSSPAHDACERSRMHPATDTKTKNFDFLVGTWTVQHRRLVALLQGSDEWYTFEGSARALTLFGGGVSVDEIELSADGQHGMSVRLYEPDTGAWTIYWVNSRDGRLQLPVTGFWRNGEFVGEGTDVYERRPIHARYHWHAITPTSARWEQAFSVDGGSSWETNWIMDWSRT
jgi:hypothetical protein